MAQSSDTHSLSPLRERVCTDTWRELLSNGIERQYRSGEPMLVQGAPATSVLILTEGRVEVSYLLQDGSFCMIALRGAGDVVGELASSGSGVRSATVRALETCTAYSVPTTTFLRVLAHHGDRVHLDRYVLAKMQEASRATVEAARLPARRRLALLLLRVVALADQSDLNRMQVPMSQMRIAEALGVSRSIVAQLVSDLRAKGILTMDRPLVIAQPSELRRLAATDPT